MEGAGDLLEEGLSSLTGQSFSLPSVNAFFESSAALVHQWSGVEWSNSLSELLEQPGVRALFGDDLTSVYVLCLGGGAFLGLTLAGTASDDAGSDSLPTSYDPALTAAYFSHRPLATLRRQADLFSKTAGFSLLLAADAATGQLQANAPLRAEDLRKLIVSQGAAFIKIGQGFAVRPDLLPEAYLAAFAKLLDQVPPFEAVEAAAVLREALRSKGVSDPSAVFDDMSAFEKPIAAASIGQVYQAKLKTGELVAVKLQRPNILGSVSLDLHLIRSTVLSLAALPSSPDSTSLASRVAKQAKGFLEVLDLAAERFLQELDYEAEAANSVRFATLMAGCASVCDAIVVPRVYGALSSRSVLVQQWVEGVKLSELSVAEQSDGRGARLVRVLLLSWMAQLLETGFLHADPHPCVSHPSLSGKSLTDTSLQGATSCFFRTAASQSWTTAWSRRFRRSSAAHCSSTWRISRASSTTRPWTT